jgi:hypothetical protein
VCAAAAAAAQAIGHTTPWHRKVHNNRGGQNSKGLEIQWKLFSNFFKMETLT